MAPGMFLLSSLAPLHIQEIKAVLTSHSNPIRAFATTHGRGILPQVRARISHTIAGFFLG